MECICKFCNLSAGSSRSLCLANKNFPTSPSHVVESLSIYQILPLESRLWILWQKRLSAAGRAWRLICNFVKCFQMNLSSGGHQVILQKQVLDTPTVAGLLLSFYDGGSVVNHLANNAYKNLLLCVCVRNSGTDGSWWEWAGFRIHSKEWAYQWQSSNDRLFYDCSPRVGEWQRFLERNWVLRFLVPVCLPRILSLGYTYPAICEVSYCLLLEF